MTYKTADKYVSAPKAGGKAWLQPVKVRTRSYTPDLSINNGTSNGSAPKCNKQPTEA
jgi:hypothetical protein